MQSGYIADESAGYAQITSLATAVGLGTIPLGTTTALIRVETQNTRWRLDGTNPTATVGYPLLVGEELRLTTSQLAAFRIIESTAGAVVNVCFFK